MMMDVRSVHLEMTEALHQHTLERFNFIHRRFDHLIRSVSIRLVDDNGVSARKHGPDKICKVIATLRNSTQVVVEQMGTDLYNVIDMAAGRFKQVLGRKVNRLPRSRRRDRTPASGTEHPTL